MRIGINHILVFLFLPVFWYFSSDALTALKLFLAYTLVFYFPGYLLATFFMDQFPPVFRTIAGIFLGVAVMPQLLYYLSLFSNPVSYTILLLLSVISVWLIIRFENKEKEPV